MDDDESQYNMKCLECGDPIDWGCTFPRPDGRWDSVQKKIVPCTFRWYLCMNENCSVSLLLAGKD